MLKECDTMVEEDDLREFDDLTKKEKKDMLRRLVEDLDEAPGTLENFGVQGEVQVRVLDEDGGEKTVETESFKY